MLPEVYNSSSLSSTYCPVSFERESIAIANISSDIDVEVMHDVTNSLECVSIPFTSSSLFMASHHRESNVLLKSIIIHALPDVLLQLKP